MRDETLRAIARLIEQYPLNCPEYPPTLPELLVVLNGVGKLQAIANGQNRIRGYVLSIGSDRIPFRFDGALGAQHRVRCAMWRYLLTRAGYEQPIGA